MNRNDVILVHGNHHLLYFIFLLPHPSPMLKCLHFIFPHVLPNTAKTPLPLLWYSLSHHHPIPMPIKPLKLPKKKTKVCDLVMFFQEKGDI
jgi:hypothetical protein